MVLAGHVSVAGPPATRYEKVAGRACPRFMFLLLLLPLLRTPK